ncbi:MULTISPECIES: hypothetical protein [Stenotrophomonas]|uniref:hypothetical protein n=1 Tax=Stenotrophomonas sp. CFBP8994 TaxID=3096527 RepID=UPI002A6A1C39|nr:hypothetical protein [Stenotrophomonas sp. CFBP8994]MDY0980730.1 hypothetical protein [Stenotrophomonas sp. CFBP8994]
MINHVPALVFMQQLKGTYCSADGLATLSVERVGYGQSIELRLEDKVQLAGVVGVSGNSVELFAQVGLPNVVRLTGQLRSQTELVFNGSDMSFGLSLASDGDTLTLVTSFKGRPGMSHVLQRV